MPQCVLSPLAVSSSMQKHHPIGLNRIRRLGDTHPTVSQSKGATAAPDQTANQNVFRSTIPNP
jgi:hypothetical protein